MMTRTLLAGLAAGTLAASANAAVLADLYTDFVAGEAAAAAGDNFSTNNWTLQGSDGAALVYDAVGILGNNDPTGYHHPSDVSVFGFEAPAISQEDIFDGGTVPANHLALHASGTNDLQIIWTADQDYANVAVNYFYDRVGDNGAADSGTSTLEIGGTAGLTLAQTAVAGDGQTAAVGSVLAGQTVIITIGSSNGQGAGGEAAGNFQIVDNVPEPSSLALLGLGGLLIARRRRG